MLKSYKQIGKKNCSIDNYVTYPVFVSNKFVPFSECVRIFQFFLALQNF